MRLAVISDIHVGSGPLDDCDAELESGLVAFFEEVAAGLVPTTLVINGDFLDFAQAEPWQSKELESSTVDGVPLCFTEEQSVEKLKGIVRAHAAVFEGLGRIAGAQSKHHVVVLPGNHDADFFWNRVREEFVLALTKRGGGAGRLRFHLQQAYRPAEFPGAWIEHGHQYDDCNKFEVIGASCWSENVPPIFPDQTGVPRLLECVGTRFMINFLNALDADYPFVDNVKPFSKFVKMFLASSAHPRFGPLKAMIALWGFLKFFAVTLGKSPRDLLSTDTGPDAMLRMFKDRLGDMTRSDAERLVSQLTRDGFNFEGMPFHFYLTDEGRLSTLLDFLCTHPEAVREIHDDDSGLLSGGDAGYMTLGAGYLIDETAVLKTAARKIITQGLATAVIMGHTHEPVSAEPALNYVNIGSWTRYLRDGRERKVPRSWNLLKKSAYEHFPYELAYAEILSEDPGKLERRVFRT